MNVNEDDFLVRFYNEFLLQSAELSLLRSLLLNHISGGDKEKMIRASGMIDVEKYKLFEKIASETNHVDESEEIKKLKADIKSKVLCH